MVQGGASKNHLVAEHAIVVCITVAKDPIGLLLMLLGLVGRKLTKVPLDLGDVPRKRRLVLAAGKPTALAALQDGGCVALARGRHRWVL